MGKSLFITTLTLLIVALIIVTFLTIYLVLDYSANEKSIEYSYTTAICDKDSCQDYVVVCNGTEIVSKDPITGASITINENFVDPRPQELIENFCAFSN